MSDLEKINDWSQRIHQWAVEKGWWEGGIKARDIDEIVANFHSEVSEAWEEYRACRMETWYSRKDEHGKLWTSMEADRHYSQTPRLYVENSWKPEGFWVEIADLCIRVMDTMAAYRISINGLDWRGADPHAPAAIVCRLHQHIANWTNDQQTHTQDILSQCLTAASRHVIDLWGLIELKHRYNETRPYRHGNKKA